MDIKLNAVRSLQTVLDILEDYGYNTEDTKITDESYRNDIWVILHGYISTIERDGDFDMLQFEYDLEDALIEVGIFRDVEISPLKPISDLAVQVKIELR
tara:strand:+ start:96 stop:392 length:297 start_codon:yes stop_codon:yes gene_type:complete